MHYFQFNIGDYASHTRHLSPMEDLAYRRLLDLYYLKDGEVYGDEAEVARQVGLRDYVQEVKQVLQDFFCLDEDDRWSHARCDAEIAHFRQKSEKASNAGKASAQRRSNKRSTDVQPTNNQQPITNNQEPIIHSNECMSETPVSDEQEDKFNPRHVMEFWNQTAQHLGKPKVRDLTPERRDLLKARIGQYSIDDFVTVFENIKTSPFLRGDNGWRGCTFDWVFKKANFQKILEGNYNG
jgi:uncharacterized protein YdaU (DUF1376 family)